MTYALNANTRVDDVDCIPFADGLGGAFWLAGPARDTLVCDFHCHAKHLLVMFRLEDHAEQRPVGSRTGYVKIYFRSLGYHIENRLSNDKNN